MVDVLSAVLALVGASGSVTGQMRAGGDWALRLPPPLNPKFNVVVNGECWLSTPALRSPVRLSAGDGFLLVKPVAYELSSDPELPPKPSGSVFAAAVEGVAHLGTGEGTFVIGGQIGLDELGRAILRDQLPPLLILRAEQDGDDDLRWTLQALVRELASDKPGHSLLAGHLAQALMVLIIRSYYASGADILPGWLSAMADPRIARVIAAVQTRPGKDWTVRSLAVEAGMSRSSFAGLFTHLVGCTPMRFATEWRLQLAASRLRRGRDPISRIAADCGYGSESAFGAAFGRRFNATPARYRREAERSSR